MIFIMSRWGTQCPEGGEGRVRVTARGAIIIAFVVVVVITFVVIVTSLMSSGEGEKKALLSLCCQHCGEGEGDTLLLFLL